jgi:hypothetical protein
LLDKGIKRPVDKPMSTVPAISHVITRHRQGNSPANQPAGAEVCGYFGPWPLGAGAPSGEAA